MNPQQPAGFDVLYTALTWASLAQTVLYLDGKAGRGKLCVALALCKGLGSENSVPIIAESTALSVTMYQRG